MRVSMGFAALAAVLAFAGTAGEAEAVVYCKTVGVPQGCVVRPAAPVVVAPRVAAPVVVAPRVAVPGVGAPGVGVRPGVGVNRGGPVNRVGVR